MTKSSFQHPRSDKFEIGWREFVALPDLGVAELKAKIDTGARTSALHAVNLEIIRRKSGSLARFSIPLPGSQQMKRCTAPIVDEREIKNTSGIPELRYVIETMLVMGSRHWHIEVSLADRENMEFDLILGRTAIRGKRLLINPGSSFLAGLPVGHFAEPILNSKDGVERTLMRGKPANTNRRFPKKGHEK